MKNIILCEGSTDGILLQYFMRKVHQWEDVKKQKRLFGEHALWFRSLKKGNDKLDIVSCDGSSRLLPCIEYLLELNKTASLNESYNKVIVVTDRDEYTTEEVFITAVGEIFTQNSIHRKDQLEQDKWIECVYESANGRERSMEILLLVIPFEDNGAMETFLLNAIGSRNAYDAEIIRQGNLFIDSVDPERRYLTKRRYVTKAKFDVYFSVRTSAAQFRQRQDIIKEIEWENYIDTQSEFAKLADL